MNLLSGFGSSASKSLVIRFIADTARASRNIDKLSNKVKNIGGGSAFGKTSGFQKNLDALTLRHGSYLSKMRGFEGGLKAYTSGFDRLSGTGAGFRRKMDSYAQGIKGIGVEATKTGSSIGFLSGKLGGITAVVIGLGLAMKKAFSMGTMVENSIVSLEVLQGSAEKARETMKSAMEFSLRTPFKPTEVLAATQAAAQYNIDLYKKGKYGLGKDQNVAQILAGMGSFVDLRGNKIGMGRATHAVMRGDYRLLRQYRGLVSPAFEAAKGKGKVGTPEFTREFIKGLGKIPQIMDMAKRQSETVSGLWSTIAGSMDIFWTKLTGASEKSGVVTMWSHVRDILFEVREGILNLIDYIGPGLTEVGAVLGSFFKIIWKITKVVGTILAPAFKVIWFIIRAIAVILEWVFSKISKILDFFIKIYDKINSVISSFDDMDDKRKKKGPGLFEDAIAFLKAQLMLADVMFNWVMNALWDRISHMIDVFARFIKSIASGRGIQGWITEERAISQGKQIDKKREFDKDANEIFIKKHASDAQKRVINAPLTEEDKNLISEGVKTEKMIRGERTTAEREYGIGGGVTINNYMKMPMDHTNNVNFGKPESVR